MDINRQLVELELITSLQAITHLMKSSGNCHVEISVTRDGLETVESVPECLQEAFLSSSPTELETSRSNHVTLPKRYTLWVNSCSDVEEQNIRKDLSEETLSDREKDLCTALEWIKEEMVIMKGQDISILKQLVALRSKILQLRRTFELAGSCSNLSLDDNMDFLDDQMDGSYLEMSEFRSRTSSMLVAGNRKPPPITRIKWKSHEYL